MDKLETLQTKYRIRTNLCERKLITLNKARKTLNLLGTGSMLYRAAEKHYDALDRAYDAAVLAQRDAGYALDELEYIIRFDMQILEARRLTILRARRYK